MAYDDPELDPWADQQPQQAQQPPQAAGDPMPNGVGGNTGIAGGLGLPNSDVPSNSDLIKQQYKTDFNRDPNQAELNSDLGNLDKYSWDSGPFGGVKATIDARMTNTPNQDEHAPAATTSKYSSLMSSISSATNPTDQAVARDRLARQVFDDLQAAGHDVNWDKDELVVDGRRYTVGGIADATKYTPGEIGTDDIPNMSVDDWMSRATAQTPVEQAADQVMLDVLGDPYGGFDETYSGNLKAQAKDASAEQWSQQDQSISDMAHQLGQDATTSPWAASARLDAMRGRDLGLAGLNTDIDIKTQDLRSSKQREAAGLGASYAGQKASQRMNALTLASDNVFKQAALTGDRLALRESVKQAAASLGIQTDKLMSDYIVSKQRELTSRMGLALGFEIDSRKLDQESEQFKEDLAMRMSQLEEAQNEFDANYGANRDDEAWRRAHPEDR